MIIQSILVVVLIVVGLISWLVVCLVNPKNVFVIPRTQVNSSLARLRDSARMAIDSSIMLSSDPKNMRYNWDLLAALFSSMIDVGQELSRAPLQVERFSGKTWLQMGASFRRSYVGGENRQTLSEHVVRNLGREITRFVDGVEARSVTQCYDSLGRAYYIVLNNALPRSSHLLSQKERQALRDFESDSEQFIHEFFDLGKSYALDRFMNKWINVSREIGNSYLFLYLRAVDSYRHYFYILREQRDVQLDELVIRDIKQSTVGFNHALQRDDVLGQYRAISRLVTAIQRAKGDDPETFVCRFPYQMAS